MYNAKRVVLTVLGENRNMFQAGWETYDLESLSGTSGVSGASPVALLAT